LVKGGKEKAYAGVFKNPPQSTRQVMEPATYLAGEKLPEMPVPDIAKLLGKDWEKYDVGSIGEFDVALMAEIYADPDTAIKIYPQWRGGWYYAAKRKNADVKAPDDVALVMVTKWATRGAAQAFQTMYAATIPKRYNVISGSGTSWSTANGPVKIEFDGDTVVVIESVPAEQIETIRKSMISH
jgi:hypothetical protein